MSHCIDDDMLRAITAELGHASDEFDSHDVIFAIMRRHPQAYVTDLYSFVSSPDPILSLHASIGQRLLKLDTIEPTTKRKSRNARGEETENQKWRGR